MVTLVYRENTHPAVFVTKWFGQRRLFFERTPQS